MSSYKKLNYCQVSLNFDSQLLSYWKCRESKHGSDENHHLLAENKGDNVFALQRSQELEHSEVCFSLQLVYFFVSDKVPVVKFLATPLSRQYQKNLALTLSYGKSFSRRILFLCSSFSNTTLAFFVEELKINCIQFFVSYMTMQTLVVPLLKFYLQETF